MYNLTNSGTAEALIEFRDNMTNFDDVAALRGIDGWNSSDASQDEICTWTGVVCGGTSNNLVLGLSLPGYGLEGEARACAAATLERGSLGHWQVLGGLVARRRPASTGAEQHTGGGLAAAAAALAACIMPERRQPEGQRMVVAAASLQPRFAGQHRMALQGRAAGGAAVWCQQGRTGAAGQRGVGRLSLRRLTAPAEPDRAANRWRLCAGALSEWNFTTFRTLNLSGNLLQGTLPRRLWAPCGRPWPRWTCRPTTSLGPCRQVGACARLAGPTCQHRAPPGAVRPCPHSGSRVLAAATAGCQH